MTDHFLPYDVPCSTCNAQQDRDCVTPSGRPLSKPHVARVRLARGMSANYERRVNDARAKRAATAEEVTS